MPQGTYIFYSLARLDHISNVQTGRNTNYRAQGKSDSVQGLGSKRYLSGT